MMIKNKLEKNTVINKIVPDFMDTLYIFTIFVNFTSSFFLKIIKLEILLF